MSSPSDDEPPFVEVQPIALPRGRWRPPQPYALCPLAPVAEAAGEDAGTDGDAAPSFDPRDPPPSAEAASLGAGLPPLRYGGALFDRDCRIRSAWYLGLQDRQAVVQWDAGRVVLQTPSPVWVSERPKAVYCILRLRYPGQPSVYRSYADYRSLTHPNGVWRPSISRGFPTEAEARIYLLAVDLRPPPTWIQ